MVFIPFPPELEGDNPVTYQNEEFLEQRRLTDWFIKQDPTYVILTPRGRSRTASGGYVQGDLTPRALQEFKFIYGGNTGAGRAGIVRTGDGTERMFSYVLLGRFDAVMAPFDHWIDEKGQHWEIEEVMPYNGYEQKAAVRSYGSEPQYG